MTRAWVWVLAVACVACRGRGAAGPESDPDAGAWGAPPGVAPADADSVWLRRVLGQQHDFVRYLDEPAVIADPALRIVFERVRGTVRPEEQRVTLTAVGGPNCSARGGCRDRLTVVAGFGVGAGDPVDDGWVLLSDVDGGELYVPAEADEPLLARFDGVVITALGYDAGRVRGVLDELGAPPQRVRLGPTLLALYEHTGGYYFRANPSAGHGRGLVRSATWISLGEGAATRNATVFEAPGLAFQAAQTVAAGPPTVEGPSGAVLQQAGALLVTRADTVLNVEQLVQPVATPDLAAPR